MTHHFRYGGSTAARTIGCPAWQQLREKAPKRLHGSNPYADEGTMLHNCMEEFMMEDKPFHELLQELLKSFHYCQG